MRPGFGPPNPVERSLLPGSLVLLLIIAAIVHDKRSNGTVHPAYWWGFGGTLALYAGRLLAANSQTWYGITDYLLRFSG